MLGVAPSAGAAPPTRSPAAASAADAGDRLQAYRGETDLAGLARIRALGVDPHDLSVAPLEGGRARVEVVLTGAQARGLERAGVDLDATAADRGAARTLAAAGDGVFRPYSGPGGLAEELRAQARAHPGIAELVTIGRTVQGKPILAVKVTKGARAVRDGSRPATVYLGAQHAREWITPEMVRRLLDDVLDGYATDRSLRRLVDTNELWFIPVGNPDGYDFTFTEGNRLWRKNLRDNDENGVTTVGDGVDLNRNFETKWGYDDEGSSPNPASDTYRGPSPGSEPETQSLNRLFARITPEFLVNYHSAAELLLHGVGWQVATPTPDDVLYQAMVGDDDDPAVPGYDPDISAELYTTNGDTDTHVQEAYGTLGFTPEMATCQSASAVDPDDAWDPDDCQSVFNFPDDEALIQAEYEKNVPFALAVARSAADPDDPVSVTGIDTPDFVVDAFEVSYGTRQPVAVTAKRALRDVVMRYRVNGRGPVYRVPVREWRGGERYGDENDDYYAELRGVVRGAREGDRVTVWFEGRERGLSRSERFTYTVENASRNDVLVVANEDYTGVNPTYPDEVTAPKHLQAHLDALAANGVGADTWDVDAQGVPHHLGVLGHYGTVLWYLGDNRLTQDPEDELTEYGSAQLPDASVAERQQYLTIAVRDFLNEGGKLVHAGETAAYYGILGSSLGGIYYGLDGRPEEPCAVTVDPTADCLLLADDFSQYYLGAYARTAIAEADGVAGTAGALAGLAADFGGPATVANPVDEVGAFTPLSEVLDPATHPWFGPSTPAAEYVGASGPFLPVEGRQGAAAEHADDSWMRLTRTYDLTGLTAADAPAFAAQLSWDTEEGYDHVVVEARTPGGEDWTTLPEAGGATSSAVPTECEAGFLLEEHPALLRYLTPGDPCTATGTSGAWNSLTGSSDGWQDLRFDLSAYAGGAVEVTVSYVTDPFTGGAGVIVDDTRLVTAGGEQQEAGFEDGLAPWTVPGEPEGSPANTRDFELSLGLGGITAAIATEDTVLLGFGLEQLASDEARAALAGAALRQLGAVRP
ncbi:zinc carboxypeptidase [Vallicoccus soli]|uniref:Zinc carboxypeptidase n=1 Tax=Vallicoccus soli TaxID=2339232 RepID=A0A3A3YY08_9ACTN|nr:zinc carboxypeptidase [Vallicoccus soli]